MFALTLKCENLYFCVKYYKNSEIVNQVVKIYIYPIMSLKAVYHLWRWV